VLILARDRLARLAGKTAIVLTSWTLVAAGVAGCGEASSHTVVVHTPASTAKAAGPSAAQSDPSDPATKIAQVQRSKHPPGSDSPSLARMLGQMVVARFAGSHPSPAFLARIRAGQVGGVILFADNLSGGAEATRALTGELQRTASASGNQPLLIMTDQEGGSVRRLYWAPPALAASAMSSSDIARTQGEAAGRVLRSAGINIDLAPVADVLHVPESFLGTRSFGSNPATVAARACAFADGLTATGVGFALKHFPGLGRTAADTDTQSVTVDAPVSALRVDYQAYRECGAQPDAMVMISSAAYPSLTGTSLPAVLSPEIYRDELPNAIGGEPFTISDDLQTPGIVDRLHPAQQAINAGLDLLMYAQTEAGSSSAYSQLLSAARSQTISHTRIHEAYEAIQLFKQLLLEQATAASATGEEGDAGSVSPTTSAYIGTPTTIKPSGQSGTG
jgi:beta-N-acetylhexosaminidase